MIGSLCQVPGNRTYCLWMVLPCLDPLIQLCDMPFRMEPLVKAYRIGRLDIGPLQILVHVGP